jgi:predicted SprT family Zn-dependent metalloprotease
MSAKFQQEQELAKVWRIPFIDLCEGCQESIGTLRCFDMDNPHTDLIFYSCDDCYQELMKETDQELVQGEFSI